MTYVLNSLGLGIFAFLLSLSVLLFAGCAAMESIEKRRKKPSKRELERFAEAAAKFTVIASGLLGLATFLVLL